MPEAAPASGRNQPLQMLATACALLLAALACFRAIVGFEPMAWWSSDPFETQVFSTGLRPAEGLLLDAASIVLSVIGLASHAILGGRAHRWAMRLALVGTV